MEIPEALDITVMTLNVGNGVATTDHVVHALRHSGADVVALEELNQPQALAITAELADVYPHHAHFGDSYEGRGVFSRYPITVARPVIWTPERPDVEAVIDCGGVVMRLVVAHPRPQRLRRSGIRFGWGARRQLVQLGRYAMQHQPAVLLGDLNMTPRNPGYRRIVGHGLIDAFAARGEGRGFTFPVRLAYRRHQPGERPSLVRTVPVLRYDYVWHTPDIEALACWVGPDVGSDHLPVLARLRLPAHEGEH